MRISCTVKLFFYAFYFVNFSTDYQIAKVNSMQIFVAVIEINDLVYMFSNSGEHKTARLNVGEKSNVICPSKTKCHVDCTCMYGFTVIELDLYLVAIRV